MRPDISVGSVPRMREPYQQVSLVGRHGLKCPPFVLVCSACTPADSLGVWNPHLPKPVSNGGLCFVTTEIQHSGGWLTRRFALHGCAIPMEGGASSRPSSRYPDSVRDGSPSKARLTRRFPLHENPFPMEGFALSRPPKRRWHTWRIRLGRSLALRCWTARTEVRPPRGIRWRVLRRQNRRFSRPTPGMDSARTEARSPRENQWRVMLRHDRHRTAPKRPRTNSLTEQQDCETEH